MAKYDPLSKYLTEKTDKVIVLAFVEIEKIINAKLPKSAREYREWWANETVDGSHVQSKAWLDGGYKVDSVDLANEFVSFQLNKSTG